MINVWYWGRVSLLSLCCDLVFSVVSKLSGLVPRCRSRTTPGELSGDFFFWHSRVGTQQLCQNQNKPPTQKSLCKLYAGPCSFLDFVCLPVRFQSCWSAMVFWRRGCAQRCPQGGWEGGKPHSAPAWGPVRHCQGEVVAAEPAVSRNCLFLLLWPLVWDLCGEAVPCWAAEVWFDVLFCCSIPCEWLSVSFLLHFRFAEINRNFMFGLR